MLDLLNVRFYGDDDDFDWSDYLDDEGSFHDDTWRDWDWFPIFPTKQKGVILWKMVYLKAWLMPYY